jgi:hypothetical protein
MRPCGGRAPSTKGKLLGWFPFVVDFQCSGDTDVAVFDHNIWSIW